MQLEINHGGYKVILSINCSKNKFFEKRIENALFKQFGHFLKATDNEKVIIEFVFTDNVNKHFLSGKDSIRTESAWINEDRTQYLTSGHGNKMMIQRRANEYAKLYYEINIPTKKNWTNNRFLSRDFYDNIDRQIAMFYTRGYLTNLHLLQLKNELTFLHGASFAKGNDAFLLTATPGAGKSSLLIALSQKDKEVHFIADDITLLDRNGCVHNINRPLSLKSHHRDLFDNLENVFESMSLAQKIQWKLLKKKGLSYRVKPDVLFGENITTNKRLKRAIYLCNTTSIDFSTSIISESDYALLNANMIFSELMLGFEILNRLAVLPNCDVDFMPNEIINNTKSVIEKALTGIECVLVKVPYRSHPNKLFQFLLDNKLI